MKRFAKVFSLVFLLFTCLTLFACDNTNSGTSTKQSGEHVDYVSQLKLDQTSSNTSKWSECTVKTYVDGDTTHFIMPSNAGDFPDDTLKARYLAINTPESTGQVEPWGKTASKFTKSKLSSAVSVIVESDDNNWNLDSTGGRYLVWVWYKTSENEDYRNLNLEILQNGLALASNSGKNKYGETCVNALAQAKAEKLHVYSDDQDPDYYYGEAQNVSLLELRTNPTKYKDTKVAFEAVVCKDYENSLYVEDFDNDTNMYIGMYIFYGYSLSGAGKDIIAVGNRVLFVGSFQFYDTGGTYQLADLKYQAMRPSDPTNIRLISEGNSASYVETTADKFANGKVNVTFVNEEAGTQTSKEYKYAELALNTSISMKNLVVTHVSTTTSETSSSKGAMTLTCKSGNVTIKVRTVVLYDENKEVVTASYFEGKTIDVKGFIDYFSGDYQIKLFSLNDVTIKN